MKITEAGDKSFEMEYGPKVFLFDLAAKCNDGVPYRGGV